MPSARIDPADSVAVSGASSPTLLDPGQTIRIWPFLLGAILCALLTVPVAWTFREGISADGLSYLEVAVNAIRLGPQYIFLNAYWSPGYPALLAVALKLTHPSLPNELAVVHTVDWLICVATYLTFTCFLLNLLRYLQLAHGALFGGQTGFRVMLVFAYTLLFVSNIDSALWYVGPNVLLECAVFLAAGLCIRLSLPGTGIGHYVLLGLVLAAGYAIKAALFPLSILLLAMLFVRPPVSGGRRGVIIATVAFLLGVFPFVAALSYSKGRLTFGDAGTLTYAWYVDHVPRSVLWKGKLPEAAVLRHPAKKILSSPPILKFEGPGPIAATYSYWYDPSWWYDGLHSQFDVRLQVQQLLRSAGLAPKVMVEGYTIFQLAEQWLPIWAGVIAFMIFGLRLRSAWLALGSHIWLYLWPAFAFFTFACVLLQHRYVVAFSILGWTALFAAAWATIKPDRWIGITLGVSIGLLLIYVPDVARGVIQERHRNIVFDNQAVTARLAELGIRPGDELASVDSATMAYYARLVGARFTMEVLAGSPAGLAKLPETEVHQVIDTLRANGARALFSSWRPAFDNDSGWTPVAEHVYVRMIP